MKPSDATMTGGGVSRSGAGLFGVLGRLKLWQKFALLGIILAPAVAVPTYQFYAASQEDVEFAKTEERGLAPSLLLMKLVQLTQQHRGRRSDGRPVRVAGGVRTRKPRRNRRSARWTSW